jgi:hypothetical protein
MKTLIRLSLLTLAVVLVLALTAGVALAASVATSGLVQVRVEEHGADGQSFTVPVPAALVHSALGVVRLARPEGLREAREQLHPFEDDLEALLDQLESHESFTLVEVESPQETVHVRKRGRTLLVEVRSPEADVHVSLPLDLVRAVLRTVSA